MKRKNTYYYSHNYQDITKREIFFSLIIIFLMLGIGFFIYENINNSIMNSNEIYSKSLRIYDLDGFNHALSTNVGNVFTTYTAITNTPVILPEFKNEYLYIKKIHEKYQMHTYTSTDSKGHVKVHRYWSWDNINSEEYIAEVININGIDVKGNKIFFKNIEYLELDNNIINKNFYVYKLSSNYLYIGNHERFCYEIVPSSISGSTFIFLNNNNITNEYISLYRNIDPDKLYEKYINDSNGTKIIFWIIWIILIGVVWFAFVKLENRWLEDH
jgi:hypothetical protein